MSSSGRTDAAGTETAITVNGNERPDSRKKLGKFYMIDFENVEF
jgi:hypothetical protein